MSSLDSEATVFTSGFGAWFKALKECAGKKSECGECLEKRTTTNYSSNDCSGVEQNGWIQDCAGGRFFIEGDQDSFWCTVRQGILEGKLQEILKSCGTRPKGGGKEIKKNFAVNELCAGN